MLLGFDATGGENILQEICHFQVYNRDLEACLWGRSVQFKTYISEMLQRYLNHRNECFMQTHPEGFDLGVFNSQNEAKNSNF